MTQPSPKPKRYFEALRYGPCPIPPFGPHFLSRGIAFKIVVVDLQRQPLLGVI
jgi:hypothetical protein